MGSGQDLNVKARIKQTARVGSRGGGITDLNTVRRKTQKERTFVLLTCTGVRGPSDTHSLIKSWVNQKPRFDEGETSRGGWLQLKEICGAISREIYWGVGDGVQTGRCDSVSQIEAGSQRASDP